MMATGQTCKCYIVKDEYGVAHAVYFTLIQDIHLNYLR